MQFASSLRAVMVGLALAVGSAAQGQPRAPVPIEAFFQNPSLNEPAISPTGRQFLVLERLPGRRQELLLVDSLTLDGRALVALTDSDVDEAHWVNDRRLVYRLADLSVGLREDKTRRIGLVATDVDGKDIRRIMGVGFFSATRNRDTDANGVLAPKTDRFYDFDGTFALTFLNSRKNWRVTTDESDKWWGAKLWLLGPTDVAEVAAGLNDGRVFVVAWNRGEKKWRSILKELDGGQPVAIAPDHALLVRYWGKDDKRDKSALYRFDTEKLSYDEDPLVASDDFDVDPTVLMDGKRLLGARFAGERVMTQWFDDKLATAQRDVDAALPGRVNELQVPQRPEVPLVLVHSFSDRYPGGWYIFDTAAKSLKKIGDVMPGVDPQRMAAREFVRYKARDGLAVPAWLTLPPGGSRGSRLPMVVLVHGGPYVRGADWRWDAESQFLASRGYAVMEPQFRGTKGYGMKHFTAGFKQWGLAMQDDLADAARWAIEQGIADPSRICIAWASYGGYASMMGLIKDPDLFKCGINWLGVTDIDLMYSAWFSDMTDDDKLIMSLTTADRNKDADQIKATSPLELAGKIRQPVLLAYGGEDKRVPITHGKRFLRNLQATNKDVEWIEYPEEGHGWRKVSNRVDFWRRVEAFLSRNIGQTPAAIAR